MYLIFAAARLFPYWALPLALVLTEVGRFYRRRLNQAQWVYWGSAGALVFFTVLWFAFGGYVHSDRWVRFLFGV